MNKLEIIKSLAKGQPFLFAYGENERVGFFDGIEIIDGVTYIRKGKPGFKKFKEKVEWEFGERLYQATNGKWFIGVYDERTPLLDSKYFLSPISLKKRPKEIILNFDNDEDELSKETLEKIREIISSSKLVKSGEIKDISLKIEKF